MLIKFYAPIGVADNFDGSVERFHSASVKFVLPIDKVAAGTMYPHSLSFAYT